MFPSFKEWCDTVLHPEDTHPWDFRTREFYEEYRLKYTIAKLIQPQSILEIGVRFGYSAYSFLLGASHAEYIGLDHDEPSFGPYQGVPRVWAERKLSSEFPFRKIQTFKVDTQEPYNWRSWLSLQFDMIHIDADHSYKGALYDMVQFWPFCKRVMVVDDVAEIPEVACAVRDFIRATPTALSLGDVIAKRGAALIVRENA